MRCNVKPPRRRRASVLVMGIVTSIVLSAMVSAVAYVAAGQSAHVNNLKQMDAVFYAAEAGAQRAAWYVRNLSYHSGGVLSAPLNAALTNNTFTLNGKTYTYTTTCTLNTDYSVAIKSIGSEGSVSYTLTMSVSPPTQGIPTFAAEGNWDNKNVDIIGDVQTGGNFINSGGSGSVQGSLSYEGTATGTSDVTGIVTPLPAGTMVKLVWEDTSVNHAQYNYEDVDSILKAAAGATLTGAQDNKSFNFNTTTGTTGKKVIVVNGDVTDPDFTGAGTLYVIGNVNFTQNVTIGSTSETVNIVAAGSVNNQGDITFDKKATIYGSLYARGDWNRAQTDVYGMVYVGGVSKSNSGVSTMNAAGLAAPWFDTRAVLSDVVSSPMTVKAFSGPQP